MASVDQSAWDGPAAMSAAANSDNPASAFKAICAGRRDGDPSLEKTWALPHHKHPGDAPNAAGVRNALSRLPQTQGLTNREAAQHHLDAHMSAIQAAEKGDTKTSVRLLREAHPGIPGGALRTRAFPSEMRAHMVQKDGRQLYEVEGYATIFNRGYEMWDMFGSYTETVDATALDRSLANAPDVAFLVNHRGVTMARTVSRSGDPTLFLDKDTMGLHIRAFLNYDRQDVRDLASAISDGLIDEMSFAFQLTDGQWNDDFDQFRIMEADVNRGDVSAVNYGANPFTSIEARSADILRDLEHVPEVVARAAIERMEKRLAALGPAPEVDEPPASEPAPKRERDQIVVPIGENPGGKPVFIWRTRLEGANK